MSDTAETTNWRQLREFAGVDLEQSYVLSWHVESGTLFVEIDVYLTPEHPFYETPRPAEKVCLRPARIEFPCCEALGLEDGAGGQPSKTARTLGNGVLQGLRRLPDSRYEIAGDFGTVFIDAERPVLKLEER